MRAIAVVMTVALAACTPPARESLAVEGARIAVRPVLLQAFPTIPVEPAVNCVIDNAARVELLSMASDAAIGPTASTIHIVGAILDRPGTIACLGATPTRIRR